MEILKINSTQNKTIKNLFKLKNKKYRDLNKEFIVEGYHLVEEALKQKLVLQIFECCEEKDKKYENSILVSEAVLKHVCDSKTPQNIFALCKYKEFGQIKRRVLFLNKLQDPGNVGTLFRLARAFDFDTVIVQNNDCYNPKVLRSAQGAQFELNILNVKDHKILKTLKEKEFELYSTILSSDSVELNKINFNSEEKIVLILGNEGNGVDNEINAAIDKKIYIPISFESLNVAAAGAIIMNKIRNG